MRVGGGDHGRRTKGEMVSGQARGTLLLSCGGARKMRRRGERIGQRVRFRREWAREVGLAWEVGLAALPALAGPGAGR